MKHALSLTLVLFLLVPGFSQSPKKYLKTNQYPEALVAFLKNIEQKPNKKGPRKALGAKYALIMDSIEVRQGRLASLGATFDGDTTVICVSKLLQNYQTLKSAHGLITALDISELPIKKKETVAVNLADPSPKIAAATQLLQKRKEEAAEMHYQQALNHKTKEGIHRQRAAAREFTQAQYFAAAYKDASTLYEEARKAGTIKVLVLPYQNRSGRTDLGSIGGQFAARLASKIQRDNRITEFVDLSTEDDIRSLLTRGGSEYGAFTGSTAASIKEELKLDRVLYGTVNQILVPKAEVVVSDVLSHTGKVKVGTKKVFDKEKNKEKTVDVFEDRTANYKIYTYTYKLTLNGNTSFLDQDVAQENPFSETHVFTTERTVKVSGNDEVYKMVTKKPSSPPSDGARVNELMNKEVHRVYLNLLQEITHAEYPLIKKPNQITSN